MTVEQLKMLLDSFDVKRYHTIRLAQEQTVGDHTARVMAIAIFLGCRNFNLLHAILEHDGLEALTGDIPATAKWTGNFGEVVEKLEEEFNKQIEFKAYDLLTDEDKQLLKLSDMAELCIRMSIETLMGNRFASPIFERGIVWLAGQREKVPDEVWDRLTVILGPSLGKKPPYHTLGRPGPVGPRPS